MDSRTIAGVLLLTVVAACGARSDLRSDGTGVDDGGAGGSVSSSSGAPSCTALIIDATAIVPSLVVEGDRIYYVATQGRVMSADANTGATTLLAEIHVQVLNDDIALALDADYLYLTFDPDGTGDTSLFRISKAGGVPEQIASGRVDNVLVDATGLYWTQFFPQEAKHEVFRRRPDGTTLSLGVIDETYHVLTGVFHGTTGLLVPAESTLLTFDVDGGGATTLWDGFHVSFPFERDGALFLHADNNTMHGLFRASPDGTMVELLFAGLFERVVTDGVHWVFTSPLDMEYTLFTAPYPVGELSFLYQSPTSTSPRAVALTPTRLVLGAAYWAGKVGIQSLCRDTLGL